jgi:hypothetical protein
MNENSETINQWKDKPKSMAPSFHYKKPSKDINSKNQKEKNHEKSNIYNPWLGEINRMEKLFFFERLAAEWTSPSNKMIYLNKDINITEIQKDDDLNVENLSQKTQKNTNSTRCESKINNVESSSISMASQKNDDRITCNICNKSFKQKGLKQHLTKTHKGATNGEIKKFFLKQ